MTLLPCSPCCACDNCADSSPTKLVATVTNPDGNGEIIAAGADWGVVETTCRPPVSSVGIGYVNIVKPGTGYTSAPTPQVSAGNALLECELRRPIASVTVSNGGSGYTSIPVVSFPNGQQHRAASATAVVRGTITSITRIATGSGYLAAPRVTVEGGTGLVATANMTTGSLHSFTVTDGGSGYTTVGAPTVTLTAGGGSGAEATATISDEKVASIAVTNGGSGYTTPPRVVFTGGGGGGAAGTAIIENGTVVAITVNEGGSGYTSTPAVSFQVGGGPGSALAFATVQGGKVVSITISNAGSGFLSPPVVTLSGGAGSGAKATAAIRFRVNSVTVTSGGTGYATSAPVTFTGGGGSGATARMSVSGSVTEVIVNNGGLYSNTRRTDGSEPWTWPTVQFTGGGGSGAAATINASPGGIYDITIFSGGSGYTTAPTITFSGGGGTGAEAVAVLTWAESQVVKRRFDDCFASVFGYRVCSETSSASYPPSACGGCTAGSPGQNYGESYQWVAAARTSVPPAGPSSFGWTPSSVVYPGEDGDLLFSEEAIYVYLWRVWKTQVHEILWLKSLYSRIAPAGTFELIGQPASATNVVLTPQFSQKEDLVGRPYWVVDSVTLTSGGQNLRLPESQAAPAAGNNFAGIPGFSINWTANYSAPVVNSFEVRNATASAIPFSVLPTFAFTFTPTGVVDGEYSLTGITVSSGGTTTAPNGTYTLAITSLSTGYSTGFPFAALPSVTLTITSGSVSSATLVSGGRLKGGGTLATATIANPSTVKITGRSGFLTTVSYAEPTVTATAPGGNDDAEFEVTLTEQEDANGNPFWVVTGVTIVNGGSGYTDAVGLDFTPEPPDGVESVPAVAVADLVPREEPTLTVDGDGLFTITYTQDGDVWAISNIEISDGGTTYENGQYLTFTLGEDDEEEEGALIEVTATLGEIDSLTIQSGGAYYKQPKELGSVTLTSGGKYYDKIITETMEPVPPLNCLGDVSEANGWTKLTYKPRTTDEPIDVGESFEAACNGIELNRTRRCALPGVAIAIEK